MIRHMTHAVLHHMAACQTVFGLRVPFWGEPPAIELSYQLSYFIWQVWHMAGGHLVCIPYGQSPHQDSWFQRVWLKHNLNAKGWNSHAQGQFPGKSESRNLSRDTLSKEIGCIIWHTATCLSPCPPAPGMPSRPWTFHGFRVFSCLFIHLFSCLC